MSIQDTLDRIGLDYVYGRFKKKHSLPYLNYIGDGQENFEADDTYFHSEQSYRIEHYFKVKNEENEKAIEAALLEDGFLYEKSPDIYIADEDVWMNYYNV